MKRIILFILSMLAFISVEAKTTFKVEGPHNVYRRIRVINQTSQENFDCRFVLLKENEDGTLTRGEVYGIYHLKGRNDIDTNTRWIDKGTLVGIEMPAGFPEDVEVSVEYNSVAIRVTLLDKNSKFESF
ncbi:MAG: hypothetical protein J6T83_07520 [Paludibacteraceae bacterium]|jgi:hypothetical protein|nr:hypothetical protein [Paludibacteraceae bacterium]MBP5524602.1 hypothetical protein [Paludibacteraceae bacterium]MBQ8020045.1 hypothetical protein [Paludibacteraceae bacterium]MDD5996517.1 hypothetical protein [Bacteroidales bacterium]